MTALLSGVPGRSQNNYADLLAAREAELARAWKQAGLKGKIDFYVSKMDGKKRPYAVCATSDSNKLKPLVVQVNGAPANAGPAQVFVAEQYAWYAKKNNRECVVIHPTGHGW